MNRYPTADDIPSGDYFLSFINTPECIAAIRLSLAAIAVVFLVSYILIKRKNKKRQGERG
ncbi:MAG: hypothetical protein K6E13_08130 [Lachnospiraceae bacterium]|nr:hypothetical protein [Lachnospiraceae bacterium]